MLPDDLENLAQSVVATNFFSNNILQAITTKNYWDVLNEYKPLMHTWSLAIEEQYYFLYPILFLLLSKKRKNWILPILWTLTIGSICIYLLSFPEYTKFYFLPFRFFELSIGGITALYHREKLFTSKYGLGILIGIMVLLFWSHETIPNEARLITTVLLTALLLKTQNDVVPVSRNILMHPVMVGIGKISFSLYMWHQLVLAYGRYSIYEHTTLYNASVSFILIFILSLFSYYAIEKPFRNPTKVKTPILLGAVISLYLITTSWALYVYHEKGVLRDVPELNLYTSEEYEGNIHIKYNDRIYGYNRDFSEDKKIKVLIIGNSFARDWANILLESSVRNDVDISYVFDTGAQRDLKSRIDRADVVFVAEMTKSEFAQALTSIPWDDAKVWGLGTKRFGANSGIFYNAPRDERYCLQRAKIPDSIWNYNEQLKREWGSHFVNLLDKITDESHSVPVFTPDCKFISQDCRHLTQAGAQYFAQLLEEEIIHLVGVAQAEQN